MAYRVRAPVSATRWALQRSSGQGGALLWPLQAAGALGASHIPPMAAITFSVAYRARAPVSATLWDVRVPALEPSLQPRQTADLVGCSTPLVAQVDPESWLFMPYHVRAPVFATLWGCRALLWAPQTAGPPGTPWHINGIVLAKLISMAYHVRAPVSATLWALLALWALQTADPPGTPWTPA